MPGGDYRDALRTRAGWTPQAGPAPRRRRVAGRRASRDRGVHRRPAAGSRGGARRAALRRRASTRSRTRSSSAAARTSRRTSSRSSARRSSRRAAPTSRSGRRSGSATVPRRSRRRSRRSAIGAGRSRTDIPVWAAAPGQAAVLYDGDEVLGGGRIAVPSASGCARDGATSVRPRSSAREAPRVSLEPSLVLSVLVGVFHAALSVAIRGSAGGRLPLLVAAAILGRVGG